MEVGFDGDVVGFGVGVGGGEVGDALPAEAGALEVGGVGGLVGEDEGVEEGGEGVHVVTVGEDGGVEAALDVGEGAGGLGVGFGAVHVVGLAFAALLVVDGAGLGFFGEFLGFLDAFGVGFDGVALALEGAVEFDAGGVAVAELEVVEGLVGVEHHLVVGTAPVGEVGLVGEHGGAFGADADFGGGFKFVDLGGGVVEGGEGAGEVGDAGGDLLGSGGEEGLVGLGVAGGGGLAGEGGAGLGLGIDGKGKVGEGGGTKNDALFEAIEDGVLAFLVFLGVAVGLGDGGGKVAGANGGVAGGGLLGVSLAAGEGEGGEEDGGGDEASGALSRHVRSAGAGYWIRFAGKKV